MGVEAPGVLPEWRYRAIARPAARRRNDDEDPFQTEAEGRLAAEGLPWCFAEMNYPHWRRVPLSCGDTASASYYVDGAGSERRRALERLVLCARCPVFARCRDLTMAKKSTDPSLGAAAKRKDLLAALAHM